MFRLSQQIVQCSTRRHNIFGFKKPFSSFGAKHEQYFSNVENSKLDLRKHQSFLDHSLRYSSARFLSTTYQNKVENASGQVDLSSLLTSKDSSAVDSFKTGQEINELVIPHSDTSSQLDVSLLEPSFADLGLNNFTPSGGLQTFMELIHLETQWPWWATIVLATALLRISLFPVVIQAQKNMVKMNNAMPEIQKRQVEMRNSKSMEEFVEARKRLQAYFEENNLSILTSYFPVLFQGVVFCSMFFAIRGMVNAPVESFATQGLYWFPNLTLSDPYYILPIVTATSVFVQLRIGADGMNPDTFPPLMKRILYAMPIISIPIMCQFPAALNVYWLTNNLISIVQAATVRYPPVRSVLGLGTLIKHKPEDLPMNNLNTLDVFQQLKKNLDEAANKKSENQNSETNTKLIDADHVAELKKNIKEELLKELENSRKKQNR